MNYKRTDFVLNGAGFFCQGEPWTELGFAYYKRIYFSPCRRYIAKTIRIPAARASAYVASKAFQDEYAAMEFARIEGLPVIPCLMADFDDLCAAWWIEPRVELAWTYEQEKDHLSWWENTWAGFFSVVTDIDRLGNNWGIFDGKFAIYDCSILPDLAELGPIVGTSDCKSYGWEHFHV